MLAVRLCWCLPSPCIVPRGMVPRKCRDSTTCPTIEPSVNTSHRTTSRHTTVLWLPKLLLDRLQVVLQLISIFDAIRSGSSTEIQVRYVLKLHAATRPPDRDYRVSSFHFMLLQVRKHLPNIHEAKSSFWKKKNLRKMRARSLHISIR